MNVLALDLSLTRTGYALSGDHGADLSRGVLIPPKSASRGMGRLAWIRDAVLSLAVGNGADVVVLEGYAYARANQAHQLGELGGVVRLALADHGFAVVDVPPAVLKRLATGKGNASKDEVLAEAIRRLGYQGSDHNEADALWLRQLALHALRLPGAVDLPKAHLAAIDRGKWAEVAPDVFLEAVA